MSVPPFKVGKLYRPTDGTFQADLWLHSDQERRKELGHTPLDKNTVIMVLEVATIKGRTHPSLTKMKVCSTLQEAMEYCLSLGWSDRWWWWISEVQPDGFLKHLTNSKLPR